MTETDAARRLLEATREPFPRAREAAEALREKNGLLPAGADPAVARLAAVLTRAMRAAYILQVGGSGYIGLHIASSLGRTGHLEIIEPDAEAAKLAATEMGEYGYEERVRVRNADVLSSVGGVNGPLDLVILVCNPELFPALFDESLRLLRVGGSLLAFGTEGAAGENVPEGLAAFLERVGRDDRFVAHGPDSMEYVLAARTR